MATGPLSTEGAGATGSFGAERVQAHAGPRNRVRPVYVFVGVFLLMLGVDAWRGASIDPAGPSALQFAAGAFVTMAGAALVLSCWRLFEVVGTGLMPDEPSARLVTTGPYRLSRNPMFVAFTWIYVGAALLLNAVWPLLALPVVIVIVTVAVIRREERYLRGSFGEEYHRYCARVPRWL